MEPLQHFIQEINALFGSMWYSESTHYFVTISLILEKGFTSRYSINWNIDVHVHREVPKTDAFNLDYTVVTQSP